MIPNQWYPILESRRVRRRPVGLRRMAQNLVLWRDASGHVHCMHDRCPHRGAALSGGRVKDGNLECPFHGFRYDPQGRCTLMPCEGREARIPAGMEAKTFPVREAHDLIWLFWGEAVGALPAIPWFDEVPDTRPGGVGACFDWPLNYVRTIETNFDVHHLPFVHGSTLPGTGARVDPFDVQVEGNHIRAVGELRKEGRSHGMPFRIEFEMPSLTLFELTKKATFLVADCPIDEDYTWRYARYFVDYVRLPGIHTALSWTFLQLDWKVFQYLQDLRIVKGLQPRRPHQGQDRLVHADAGTAAYLKLHAKLLREADAASPGLREVS